MQHWKVVQYTQHRLVSCNTLIWILSETLQKLQNGSHYRCLYITLFLQHLALHFDHANIAGKAASHPWTADLTLGQFMKTESVWGRCLQQPKGTQRCWPCHIFAWLWDTRCVLEMHFKPEPFQSRHLPTCCLCCAAWKAPCVSRWTPRVQRQGALCVPSGWSLQSQPPPKSRAVHK